MRAPAGYFDYNASAPLRPEVRAAVLEAMDAAGNPSSMHSEGRRSAALLEDARRRVAAVLDVEAGRVVFTSGATESNNLALRGALAHREGLRLITSALEHPSVLDTLRALAARGADVTILEVDREGRLDLETLARLVSERFSLVSLGWANGESGHLLDLPAVVSAVTPAVILHLDAAQAFGRVPVRATRGVDMLSVSAHKIGGPLGTGVLVVAAEELEACMTGGPQERGLRAGSENVPAIAGMAVAFELAAQEVEREAARLRTLRERLWERLAGRVPDLLRISPPEGLPNTLTFAVAGAASDVMIAGLDLDGYCVSSGSACAAGSPEPSHVVQALGVPEAYRDGVLRVSMGWATRAEQVEGLANALERVLDRARVPR